MAAKHSITVVLGVIFMVITVVLAEDLGVNAFDVAWYTVDSGGGTSSGGQFELSGSIGQPDASATVMSGGSFTLSGGFWAGAGHTASSCPADIAPSGGDGVVNLSDLLAVINAWGTCAGCAADVNHDNAVNVSDLLAVINAWGTCPL